MTRLSSHAMGHFAPPVVLGRADPKNQQSSPSSKLPFALRGIDPRDPLESMPPLPVSGIIKLGRALASFLRSCSTTGGIVSVYGVVPASTNPGPGRGSRVSAAVVWDRPRRVLFFGTTLSFVETENGVVESGIFGMGVIRPPAVACRLRGSSWSFGRSYGKYSH